MENIIYYYVVFIIVILVKLQKFLKEETKEQYIINSKYRWLEIIDGMDIAFSAAGVIIYLFLKSEPKWYQTIFSLAIFLYLVAFIADSLSSKYIVLKRSLNITVVLIIFIVTYLVFSPEANLMGVSLDKIQKHESIIKHGKKNYKVIIPYKDLSLISYLGVTRTNNLYFLFEYNIVDSLRDGAITQAKNAFLNDSSLLPLFAPKREISNRAKYLTCDFDKIQVTEN